MDVSLSFEKYQLNCEEKHRPLSDTGFNLWVRDDMNRGWNQQIITSNGSNDDGSDDMILRKCNCQSDIWVPKNIAEGNCEKCGLLTKLAYIAFPEAPIISRGYADKAWLFRAVRPP